MKKIDIFFALFCGLLLSWLCIDFVGSRGWISLLILPELSLLGLWISEKLGKKFPFMHQVGKFVLVGIFADLIDIKAYQFLYFLIPFSSLAIKAVSFLVATFIKYWWNKFWAFEKMEKDGMKKEAAKFFAVTLGGLLINVVSFYYFTKILGAQFSLEISLWTELSIIFAALAAAVWNFLGYKFVVFKK